MTEDEALALMKGPADHKQTWGGGVIQICVGRACDLACPHCTQGSNLAGGKPWMTVEQFDQAVISVQNAPAIIGVFGGSPTLHPQFPALCEVMRYHLPRERRGLWANHPHGRGKVCRDTFEPRFSNLNVHMREDAYREFSRDWPECRPFLKGLRDDSRHAPVFASMRDLGVPEGQRWDLISRCPVNQFWSAYVAVFRSALRAWFCEVAGSQSLLHEEDPDYPDTGVAVVLDWWKRPMRAWAEQARRHCHDCGVPMQGHGALSCDREAAEQVSATHAPFVRPKQGRRVELVTARSQLGTPLTRCTDYIENSRLPAVTR